MDATVPEDAADTKMLGIQAPLSQQMLKTLRAADGKVLCNTDSSVLSVLHLFERYFLTILNPTVLVRLQNFNTHKCLLY